MREVLTVSLPKGAKAKWKKLSRERGFKSVSEYVNFLFAQEEELISEDELLKRSKEADKKYVSGKLKKLKSLKDLM